MRRTPRLPQLTIIRGLLIVALGVLALVAASCSELWLAIVFTVLMVAQFL